MAYNFQNSYECVPVENELISRNRITKVTFSNVEEEKKELNYLTPDQLVTFLDDAKRNESITSYSFC